MSVGRQRYESSSLRLLVAKKKSTLTSFTSVPACQSTAPYFKMLERWIYQGMISDPYNEFMIHERKDLSKV